METTGAPPKQKRRPRKHKPKQQQLPKDEVLQPAETVSKESKATTDKENVQQQLQQEPNGQLNRNPSKRNRKRNRGKKQETSDQQIQSIELPEIFPNAQEYALENQTVLRKETVQTTSKSKPPKPKRPSNFEKNKTIENIEPERIFPVCVIDSKKLKSNTSAIEDIGLEEIFPTSEIYNFENNAVPRKLKTIKVQPKVQRRKKAQIIAGLQDIACRDIFPTDSNRTEPPVQRSEQIMDPPKTEKTREEVMAEREAKKAAKAAAKGKGKETPKPATQAESTPLQKSSTDSSLSEKLDKLHISDPPAAAKPAVEMPSQATKQLSKAERKAQFEAQNPNLAKPKAETKPATSKAERRALQEAQRAAKAEAQTKKAAPAPKASTESSSKAATPVAKKETTPTANKQVKKSVKTTDSPQQQPHMVKLFNHLYTKKFAASEIVNSSQLHPAITTLGLQYAEGVMAGSKARCLAFLKALTQMINDYETPPEKEFSRGFEETLNPNIAFLQKCRPFSVSMTNALKYIKMYTRQLNPKDSDSDQKVCLQEAIDTYVRDQIEKAEEAISISVQDKIYDGDVILTYGCSSLIKHILEEAKFRRKNFRVVIVDSRPRNQEHEMLRQLVAQGIDCTCVLINAISYVMPEVTKVLLSAHALLANGCVMSRVGTAQIALVAKSYNVPVLVCCETHKFSERVQTDAFVYNEIGNPNDLILNSGTRENRSCNPLAEWESISHLTPLNLHYDVTPPELVTAVVTEVAILPCTSVPVILRIKPSEVGY
ncbi:AAEL012514-PA [Aedes aegypti]|uniref:Translation initiation factor eIF2B subunit delta n=3 Tax=Aedes aegypti TaxID=7159 RepID=Q16LW1_AEDAE|nr:translation initiation factor eIF-2B subunit delta isoform X1 [Aedes aegypti]XP_021696949.1 translation initiation factor eIF-2B subunit delta isoform X1 [Aedes aegypti]XP_021696950.1 translation initiation factor eIF-2B subunit delta isoform X1 [Aedes aegypti]EAT35313.1 AAEL012514-PA [Aedes aegypti]